VAPQLYVTGQTDDVVLRLPTLAWPGTVGTILGAMTAAGAFAAFLSTSSGLLVSLAGTISHDVWPRLRRDRPSSGVGAATRRLRFRVAAVGAMIVPALLALIAQGVDISILVGWAFAIAASTFCPMFLLGIWWTRLTARGAAAGMVCGMTIATTAIFTGLALGQPTTGAVGALLTQPALVSVPVAFAVMILVSLRDSRTFDPGPEMLALHAPEGLGLRIADEELEPAVV
jgi:cation/acetate symporter